MVATDSGEITPTVSGVTVIPIAVQREHGVNIMTDRELYEKLLEGARSALRNDMLLNGVSDAEELAGHAWMLIKDGTWK